jgi:hypothetical protein
MGRGTSTGKAVVLLDTDLREPRPSDSERSMGRLAVRALDLPVGPFDAQGIAPHPAGWLGLLLLDGVVAVERDAGRAHTSWLMGADDLVRPWDMSEFSLLTGSAWRALSPTRIALLDADFSRRVGGIPLVTRELLARASQTTHWLMATSLITGLPLVAQRLTVLFELLAERWGTVRPDGVSLSLPLTHNLIARMTGSHRPSVTLALRTLREQGIVEPLGRGRWLLHLDEATTPTPPVAVGWGP